MGIPIVSRLANPLTQATPAAPVDPIRAGAMAAEYKDTVKALRMYGVDPDMAKRLTVEKMKAQWQPTRMVGGGGNTLMKYAPESYYPQIDKSHDWLQHDLDEFVSKVYGAKAELVGTEVPAMTPGWSLKNIVSDAQTEQEIARGQLPSYRVHIVDAKGQDQFVRDPATGADRIRWNPAAAIAAQAEKQRPSFERRDQPYQTLGQDRPFMMHVPAIP